MIQNFKILSAEPLSSDVNNNDDLPPHWRDTPTEKKVKQQLQFDNVKEDQSCEIHTDKSTPFIRTVTSENYGDSTLLASYLNSSPFMYSQQKDVNAIFPSSSVKGPYDNRISTRQFGHDIQPKNTTKVQDHFPTSIVPPFCSTDGWKDYTSFFQNTPDLQCGNRTQQDSPKKKRKFLSIEDIL